MRGSKGRERIQWTKENIPKKIPGGRQSQKKRRKNTRGPWQTGYVWERNGSVVEPYGRGVAHDKIPQRRMDSVVRRFRNER
jgi:hypothetical protein